MEKLEVRKSMGNAVMDAVFVDCTAELNSVIKERDLPVPEGLRINHGDPTQEQLLGLTESVEVICVEHTPIPAFLLDESPNLRAIIFMGTGAESYIPVEEARRRGIKVLTTPGYGNLAVAEHAMALTFAAARKVALMDRAVRAGFWQPRGGEQLGGSKIAVIGLGEIGQTYARLAAGLGMEVAGWNRTPVDASYYVDSLEDALSGAKFLSLHLALNQHTIGIIGEHELNLLSHGAAVINTARAALIDESALASALASGQVGHAGLDVLWEEPLAPGNPWARNPCVTITSHAAYMTDAAYEELWKRTVGALRSLTSGSGPIV